jgi:uncharacterized protein
VRDISQALLEKADRAIAAAETLFEIDADSAVNRAYYGMFYAAEALLAERDLRFTKHSAVHSAFGREFVKTGVIDPKYHGWLLATFNKRIAADYTVEAAVSADDARTLVKQAKEFISAARAFLASDKS